MIYTHLKKMLSERDHNNNNNDNKVLGVFTIENKELLNEFFRLIKELEKIVLNIKRNEK